MSIQLYTFESKKLRGFLLSGANWETYCTSDWNECGFVLYSSFFTKDKRKILLNLDKETNNELDISSIPYIYKNCYNFTYYDKNKLFALVNFDEMEFHKTRIFFEGPEHTSTLDTVNKITYCHSVHIIRWRFVWARYTDPGIVQVSWRSVRIFSITPKSRSRGCVRIKIKEISDRATSGPNMRPLIWCNWRSLISHFLPEGSDRARRESWSQWKLRSSFVFRVIIARFLVVTDLISRFRS